MKQTLTYNLSYSLSWALGLGAGLLGLAWATDWQMACWAAWVIAYACMVSQSWHLHTLLIGLKHGQDAVKSNQLELFNAVLPNAKAQWDESFYFLHRLLKQHQHDLSALQAQQDRFVQALQASPNAFVLLDQLGCVAWLNAASQRLLGLDAQRDTGQNLAFLLRTPAVAALLDSSLHQKPVTVEVQSRLITVQSLPFGDQQTLLLGQDFTEVARTEQVRRDFVANVSHELRTPLTVLTGYTELLQDYAHTLPPSLQEAIQHMVQHTQRMNSLTQDLLELAVLDAHHPSDAALNHEPLLVSDWLAQVQASTLPLANANTPLGLINLTFMSCDRTIKVLGNLKELHSALANLVGNAVRYTPAGGQVQIVAQVQADGLLHIAVTDTGCGIDAIHLPRLTERFYRVSRCRGRVDDTAGTGLGLAIVKHVMLHHGGELHITSTVGQGSCFSLVLPLHDS